MAEPKDEACIEDGGASAQAPRRGATEAARIAAALAEIDQLLEGAPGSDRTAGIEAEIDRLLEGFDDRLAVVNRHLDRVLEHRT